MREKASEDQQIQQSHKVKDNAEHSVVFLDTRTNRTLFFKIHCNDINVRNFMERNLSYIFMRYIFTFFENKLSQYNFILKIVRKKGILSSNFKVQYFNCMS